ncbi:sugar ABC transporter substrate-binding protein [Alkalihalobacillus alcalophilus ATCC 27647 = CGMCC 1.3604]|uniref:Sugar ABC transporter substrate-binding protein n=1 Tax=Alkalihalobacillus alcalophilus ATCC 27647 = CGMCC 1.3604 TaxID=1218173 RepID=A0A094YTH0_ALKAL|nr:sugar-binding protein [Alkalihalobacillus alcalophilus]KGA96732.1 sugar ABC transporter substrate-binding protein [Alkalihalobacillus alcalophilus ATCC 27647 = CGMCC 1.3604]MED1561758.1 sugar ABC transporter substrate-binding protein [Alkalihalobacillus alcalophilus]THG91908.1 sugar ABC transporter substrate-binding protein [Alkalihalobacillus alcalophilus ATCC 27647 = CGMCC 1.3604]
MKSSWKLVTYLIVVSMATIMLAACGSSGTSSSSGVSVGIVLPTRDEPRWVQDEQRFKDALADSEYTTEILFSQGSSANEKENVETLLNRGIDVLIIAPHDGAAAGSSVEAAKAEGVTVIAYDRLITETDAIDYYVTFDSVAVGEAQGQYLIENAQGTNVPLYLYAGASSDNNAFLFFEGAWNVLQPKIADGTFVIANSSEATALQDSPELTREEMGRILGQITTNWDPNEAINKAQTHLTAAGADLKGDIAILAPNDGTARAIADVFSTDSEVTSYFVTGQDAEQASIQYIIDGKQSMTVFKDVRTLVEDAMGMAIDVLDGNTPETTGSYNNGKVDVQAKQTDVIVVDEDNVKQELIDSEYYEASEFTGL